MNYLVKTIEHDTGEVFVDVLKIKDNETYKVIEAESREEALEMAKRPKGLLEVVPSSFNSCRSISKPIPDRKHATPPRKDSEGMNIEDTRFLCRRTHGDFKEGVYYYIIPTHIIIKEGSNDDGEYRWFCPNVNSLIKENALTRDFIQVRKDSE